ncbi:MAG: hypothetical protein ACYSWW_09425 [Planctomycetota bacterium]
MKRSATFLMITVLVVTNVDILADSADDYWPTWRGPNRMGVSPKGNPPLKWSETENIKWKIKLTGDESNSYFSRRRSKPKYRAHPMCKAHL